MAGRYRALLIGNSTYPADEHNLQQLKGPVKDIAALNRALIDQGSGLFSDEDVTLLPEATSGRAIRALGKFFAEAARDDVLLVYFSGHGKLDQGGRLHLCMHDTESTDLLSTAVSSVRINEFADVSHARNVVIVLDCCHAGAFRGSDLPDAVAGPGRYVLTSCRGTQLANDATVDNGTSFFTQQLIDGLLGGATDHDGDGYLTFSDLYTYVDRRLREAGKQIPQRRVEGDGDVPLARRPPPAPAQAAPGALPQPRGTSPPADPDQAQRRGSSSRPDPAIAGKGTCPPTAIPDRPGPAASRTRRRALLAAAAAAVVLAVGAITAFLVLPGGSGGAPGGNAGVGTTTGSYIASGPWRLKISDRISPNDSGCAITVTDAPSGELVLQQKDLDGTWMFQIHQHGSLRWQLNDPGCVVAPLATSGQNTLPFAWQEPGDSDAFTAPARIAVQVADYQGSPDCVITLNNPVNGETIDFQTATRGKASDTVVLSAAGHSMAYLSDLTCGVKVSAAQ